VLRAFKLPISAFMIMVAAALRVWGASPTGTMADLQHVVIVIQENRSFDHYFGCLGGVSGFADPNAVIMTNSLAVFYQPQNGTNLLPYASTNQCLADVDHGEPSGVVAWDNGQWDHWLIAKGPVTMAHYTRSDIPYYYALAEAYTICDNYHCSTFGPTVPNRLYTISGMIDPHSTGGGPVLDNVWPTNGLTWTTYPERLQNSGISWHIYQGPYGANFNLLSPKTFFHNFMTAQPGNPLYDHSMADTLDSITAFQQDATNGRLPRVSWIVLPWGRCEHPPSAPTTGSFFLKRIIDTLAVDPRILNSTALFLTYDENGGYFDHVPSPVPRPGTQDEFVTGVPIGLWVRVPMIIVSPWTRGGHVCSQLFDHTSMLQFLEKWTGVR